MVVAEFGAEPLQLSPWAEWSAAAVAVSDCTVIDHVLQFSSANDGAKLRPYSIYGDDGVDFQGVPKNIFRSKATNTLIQGHEKVSSGSIYLWRRKQIDQRNSSCKQLEW